MGFVRFCRSLASLTGPSAFAGMWRRRGWIVAMTLALATSAAGCHREREIKAVTATDGSAVAHFFGHVPASDPGEPPPPLEYGVASLAFTFAGDARLHRFEPTGQLFFSDWSFDVFSSDGRYAAMLESHYGPIDVVATAQLRPFLDGEPVAVRARRCARHRPRRARRRARALEPAARDRVRRDVLRCDRDGAP